MVEQTDKKIGMREIKQKVSTLETTVEKLEEQVRILKDQIRALTAE